MTPKQIADKFSLPEIPTMISDVIVPANTKIRGGKAAAIKDWGKGGGQQVQLLQRISSKNYKNTRKL